MAAFKKVMPVLRVTDLSEAVDWYTRLLGFELCWRAANDGGGETCMMEAGEVTLMLSTASHLARRPGFSGTLYFEMSGVREFFAQIQNEVEVVWPVGETEYGTVEFGVKDPDGYMLAFAEQMATD